ncbi:MAG: hypothetical protein H0W23_07190, partial [Chloroflexia bacterium]|nr:hypothetical protein [Chloroflexia bacterium]
GIVGGRIVSAAVLPDVGSEIETRLVIVRKTAPTPDAYPRRAGIPSRNPLGTNSRVAPSGAVNRQARIAEPVIPIATSASASE